MYPLLYNSEYFFLPSWHVLVTLGIIVAYLYAHHLRKKFYPSLEEDILFKSFLLSYAAAYLGARGLTIFIEENPRSLFNFFLKLTEFGGLTFFGGLLAALFVNALYFKGKREERKKLFALAAPSTLLGLSIGRIGCFLNGDDYGIAASKLSSTEHPWWSVSFPYHRQPIPRVPVQLIESFLVFSLVILLYWIQKKRHCTAESLGFFSLLSYGVLRFFLEFLRGDERGFWFGNSLSTSQVISFFLVLWAAFYFIFKQIIKRKKLY